MENKKRIERTVKYLLEITESEWFAFKNKVSHNKTLKDALKEAMQQYKGDI